MVKRFISRLYYIVRIFQPLQRIYYNTYTYSYLNGIIIFDKVGIFHCLSHPFRNHDCFLLVRLAKTYNKLLSAKSCQNFTASHLPCHYSRYPLEDLIADIMPIGIIYAFKMVYIYHKAAKMGWMSFYLGAMCAYMFIKISSIIK